MSWLANERPACRRSSREAAFGRESGSRLTVFASDSRPNRGGPAVNDTGVVVAATGGSHLL